LRCVKPESGRLPGPGGRADRLVPARTFGLFETAGRHPQRVVPPPVRLACCEDRDVFALPART